MQLLFTHDKAIDVAQSIALRGFSPNEPLLAIRENDKFIVVEGNRRLAALKALREPSMPDDAIKRQVERLAMRIGNLDSIAKAPSSSLPIADPLIVKSQASILERLYCLGNLKIGQISSPTRLPKDMTIRSFSMSLDFQRQTKAIADIARALDLPKEIAAKLNQPGTKIFTTLERIFDSTVGRGYLHAEPDPDHGIRGLTSQQEFPKGFRKLVADVAAGRESSRTLNGNEDIKRYFESRDAEDRPKKTGGGFVPSDLVSETSSAVVPKPTKKTEEKPKQAAIHSTVLPKSLKISFENARLIDIRNELVRLKRADFPNAGAVLLRVFFELSITHYLARTGDLDRITQELRSKGKLQFSTPQMKQLIPEIIRIAKAELNGNDASRVEKAIKYDPSAPFALGDLHAFVHQNSELPGERDILQFWLRTEPLFRLMLEKWPICQGKSGASISLVNLTWQSHLPVERARLYLFSFKKKFLAFT